MSWYEIFLVFAGLFGGIFLEGWKPPVYNALRSYVVKMVRWF